MTAGEADGDAARIEREARTWLILLQSGEGDQAEFEDWYCAAPLNADTYDAVRAGWGRLGIADQTPIAEARHGKAVARHPQPSRYLLAAVLAACVVVLIGAGGWYSGRFSRPSEPVIAYASRVCEVRAARLTDGSVITLDTDSAVRTAYTATARTVRLLRGRARFDVAPDSGRPFTVETSQATVSAKGALFDVESHGASFAVATLRDAVEVRYSGYTVARPVQAGYFLSARSDATLLPPRRVNAAGLRWTTGRLAFENTPLADVLAAVNRYASSKIIVTGADMAALRFTGTIRPVDTDAVAQQLAATFGLTQRRNAAGDYLLTLPGG